MWALWSIVAEHPWDDWAIPWAGIGAFLMGTGSVMTGLAALRNAQNRGKKDEAEEAHAPGSPDDLPGAGGGSGRTGGDGP